MYESSHWSGFQKGKVKGKCFYIKVNLTVRVSYSFIPKKDFTTF